jgi:hypothetical protein
MAPGVAMAPFICQKIVRVLAIFAWFKYKNSGAGN